MKATGIVRKVDELGRIVLPIELRRTMAINEKDCLEIYTDGSDIILKKYQPGCTMCGSMDKLITIGSNSFCHECIEPFARELAMRRG